MSLRVELLLSACKGKTSIKAAERQHVLQSYDEGCASSVAWCKRVKKLADTC